MEKRKLGKYGAEVSPIGVGAMSFSNFYGPTNEKESHRILTEALDQDISHIDTANVYGAGASEAAIGSFLAKQGPQRNTLFSIATKVGIKGNIQTGKTEFDNSPDYLKKELDSSLKRLGVESVDLYYIHRRDQNIPIEEVTETLAGFVKAGKIRSFGFSEIAPSSLRRAAAIHHVAAVQSEYSLSVRSPELGLVQATAELGTALVAFSPLGRSLLTDRPHSSDKVEKMDWLSKNPRFREPNLTFNTEAASRFRDLAVQYGLSAAALAIAWLLNKHEHIIPIPGTRSVKHFLEHCDGASLRLSQEQMSQIEIVLPLGWAQGDRYSEKQWIGPEKYS